MARLMLNDAFHSNFSCGGGFLIGKHEFATLEGVKVRVKKCQLMIF